MSKDRGSGNFNGAGSAGPGWNPRLNQYSGEPLNQHWWDLP